ncbi:MAG: hypothetical protein Q4G33_05765 [bacterium]|nr:hypothetical protein [bacterium]
MLKIISMCAAAAIFAGLIPASANAEEGTKFKSVSCGEGYCMAITEEGNLWGWGKNSEGQLTGSPSQELKFPQPVLADLKVKQIECGYGSMTMAVLENGELWEWGKDIVTNENTVPHMVMDGVSKVETSLYQILVLKNDGTVWNWGRTDGNKYTAKSAEPVLIMDNARDISAGLVNNLVIKNGNTLWSWGDGSIGNGEHCGCAEPVLIMQDVKSCDGGCYDSYAVLYDGTVWIWGNDEYNPVGELIYDGSLPKLVTEEYNAAEVNEFWWVNIITEEGTLYTPNRNRVRQITEYEKVLENIISYDEQTCCAAVTSDGDIYTWGVNAKNYVQGTNDLTGSHTPQKVVEDGKPVFERLNFIYEPVSYARTFDSSDTHGMAVTNNGELYVWGTNKHGELGIEPDNEYHEPFKLMDNIRSVLAGEGFSFVIKEDCSLWGWGSSRWAQLGEWDKDVLEPVKMMENVKSVYGKERLINAVDINDKLYVWGGSEKPDDESNLVVQCFVRKPMYLMDDVAKAESKDGYNYVLKKNGSLLMSNNYEFDVETYKLYRTDIADFKANEFMLNRSGRYTGYGYQQQCIYNNVYDANYNMVLYSDGRMTSCDGRYEVKNVAKTEYNLYLKNDGTLWKTVYGRINEAEKLLENIRIPKEYDRTPVGTVIGEVLSSDIDCTIDKIPINAYNVNGHMYVRAESLRAYGFIVDWNEKKKRVDIKRGKSLNLKPETVLTDNKTIGEKLYDIYSTDIIVYLEGAEMDSINIGGHTFVKFSQFSRIGDVSFDEEERKACLNTYEI